MEFFKNLRVIGISYLEFDNQLFERSEVFIPPGFFA